MRALKVRWEVHKCEDSNLSAPGRGGEGRLRRPLPRLADRQPSMWVPPRGVCRRNAPTPHSPTGWHPISCLRGGVPFL